MTVSFSNSRMIAWMMWMIASVFYAYQYVLRVMPNIMITDIMEQFQIDAATFGQFSGVYYIGYSLMHLPIGLMLDRFGPKKVMTGSILVSVVGILPLMFADYWVYPILGRIVLGMGSSAAILGIFKIIRMTFSEERFPRMLSLSVMIGLMGAIYGGAPVSYMRESLGYQGVLQLFAVAGIVLAGLTYWIVPTEKTVSKSSAIADIKEVIGNYKVMFFCLCAGLMVGPLEGFADVWGTAFLKQVYGYEGTLAASLPSVIFIGMCFGAPILSLIADKIGSYSMTIIGSGVLMALIFFGLLQWQMGSGMISLSFVLVGICCAYQILAIYQVSTYVREQVAGLATAVANMIIMIFGYAFHSMIGGVVSYMGGPAAPEALVYGIAVIPVALVIGTAGFLVLTLNDKKIVKV